MSTGAQPAVHRRQPQPAPTIARMYARWVLDCVIESALAVAGDSVKRQRQYSRVSAQTAKTLANLRSRTGSDPSFPSAPQRAAIYAPLLGGSGAQTPTSGTNFQNLSAALRAAAIAYSERAVDSGEVPLRTAFSDAARAFKVCLSGLTGGLVDEADSETKDIFDNSVKVLADDGVARAFGLPAAPESPWPVDGQLDNDGAYLIEEITRTLQPSGVGTITEAQFLALQQVAASGLQVIDHVVHIDFQVQANLTDLIAETYSWATALARSAPQ